MSEIQKVLPPSTVQWLDRIPGDRPVAMLIRHSVRGPLPEGDAGYTLPITEAGHRLALELGQRLRGRLHSVQASPLRRTLQTATRLAEGSGLDAKPRSDRLLGDPGAFVVDDRAGENWKRLGHEEMMRHLVGATVPLPGLADADAAARFLVHHMLATAGREPGVHAFVTHDSLVTATAARLLDEPLGPDDWPWCLEAAFFWEEHEQVHIAYRSWHKTRARPLVGFSEADVIALARRETAATVGLDCPARFFLAGDAFQTLLTGRAPRDLECWAPSPEDHRLLIQTLRANGAQPLSERRDNERFSLRGRSIEVPSTTGPDTLEGRLARFDLALSAVGAEFRPGDHWRAIVHPLAVASVERRDVLLLEKPDFQHCLTSLERSRRYAKELGYDAQAEARLWAFFSSREPSVQRSMIERFERTARHDQGVAEELPCHSR